MQFEIKGYLDGCCGVQSISYADFPTEKAAADYAAKKTSDTYGWTFTAKKVTAGSWGGYGSPMFS